MRGDGNGDRNADLSDAVFVLNFLFLGGEEPGCRAAANYNGDAAIDIADSVYLLNHLFTGGAPLPSPFPDCGPASLEEDTADSPCP